MRVAPCVQLHGGPVLNFITLGWGPPGQGNVGDMVFMGGADGTPIMERDLVQGRRALGLLRPLPALAHGVQVPVAS